MASLAAIPRVTETEYLELERASEHRNEFINGVIVSMTGASRLHNLITGNIHHALRKQLEGRPCEIYASDMRVKVSETGLYTYPDVAVVCGDVRIDDAQQDTLLNPSLIVEVLSASTEAYDRGEKFAHYRRLDSLREYLMVAQDKVRIEQFVRHSGKWLLSEWNRLEEKIPLEAVNAVLGVNEVYHRIVFPASGTPRIPLLGEP